MSAHHFVSPPVDGASETACAFCGESQSTAPPSCRFELIANTQGAGLAFRYPDLGRELRERVRSVVQEGIVRFLPTHGGWCYGTTHPATTDAAEHIAARVADQLVTGGATPTAEQPPPKPNTSRPIAELVLEDIDARVKLGLERYGTKLQANNGRDALADAYQEALDLVFYLRQAIAERDGR